MDRLLKDDVCIYVCMYVSVSVCVCVCVGWIQNTHHPILKRKIRNTARIMWLLSPFTLTVNNYPPVRFLLSSDIGGDFTTVLP
jgi:hypothetical protein